MPTNVSHAGGATERAGDTTTARSYRASFAERERLHLRQEFHFGRRAFKPNSTVATRGPPEWIKYQLGKAISEARMRRDPAHFIARTGRRQWAKPWYWETLKSRTGYDAPKSSTVLAHVFECWNHWLAVTHIPKKHNRRYTAALVLARRVLRRWRHWTVTVWEQLLAPTWQQVRLNARSLPPLSMAPCYQSRPHRGLRPLPPGHRRFIAALGTGRFHLQFKFGATAHLRGD
jgi:hypothetical protein